MRDFAPVTETVSRAYAAREQSPRRLFHGRGRRHPGFEDVTVDLFPPYLMVSAYGDDEAGPRQLAEALAEALPGLGGVALQVRDGRGTRWETVSGEVAGEHVVTERGLAYRVRLGRNQNVGLFLDMAPVRDWLRDHSGGARVVNLFAYTCAFSVAAMAGGAHQVVNNDMSRAALEWGRENHALNGHDPRSVRMVPHNLFRSWWKLRQLGPYDLMIVDPPTRQRGSFDAAKQYRQVLKRIPELVVPGGRVVACLNSPFLGRDFLGQEMARACPDCELIEWLPASADFADAEPERALKVGLFRYAPS